MNGGLATLALALSLAGCSPPLPPVLEVQVTDAGVEVTADVPLVEATLLDDAGRVLDRRALPSAAPRILLLADPPPGASLRVTARAAEGPPSEIACRAPVDPGPVRAAVAAPAGQGERDVADGARLEVPVVAGTEVQAALRVVAHRPGPVRLALGAASRDEVLSTRDEARLLVVPMEPGIPLEGRVSTPDGEIAFTLDPRPVPMAEARERLRLATVVFPADTRGAADLARPPNRVTLPSPLWRSVLRRLGLGTRPRDDQAPWAWEGVTLENHGPTDLNVVLRSRVVDDAGHPVHAFRPRLRDANEGLDAVSALLRVPAGTQATATLPLYVDDDEIPPEGLSLTRTLEVIPLGATEPLLRDTRPLHVGRGSAWASLGTLLALTSGAVGLAWAGLHVLPRLVRQRTSDLTTVALFASLSFVAAVASQALGMAVAAGLGPFSPLVTGLVEDAFRTALLATLVTLLPRPGTVALALILSTLLRALALGGAHPLDLVTLGSSLAFLETSLWWVGCTRGEAWRDGAPWIRALRLALGFGIPTALSTLCAFSIGVVFYRLFYATWYVLLMAALPGFAYVALAASLAVPFADSLRRVAD